MLCLSESIRDDDPGLQQGLQTAYDATNLTELILEAVLKLLNQCFQ